MTRAGKPPFDPADAWVEVASFLVGLILAAVLACLT